MRRAEVEWLEGVGPSRLRVNGEFGSLMRHLENKNQKMKKATIKRKRRDELRHKHNLSKLNDGVRGKYTARYRAGTNLVLLSPDMAEHFPDGQSVNKALRTLIPATKGSVRRAR